ncbi:OmpA family protein [Olivibacter ginsenosidimutans]|uniref:OmpA family protein n=2 Tax=Olivibacter ginsenosidimutans TaxID=1176537 RepID=A0ABP9AQ31_9SPHI
MSPAAYESLIHTQDSLSRGWKEAQIENGHLEDELAKLKADTASLSRKLVSLEQHLSSSSSEVKKLSANLAEREQRLQEVEDILHKRDEANNRLKNTLQQALLGFQENGLSVDMHEGKVYVRLADKLLFSSGSIVIDERGKQALTELAKVLNTRPEINIAVEGHTDDQKVRSLGQIKDNWDLSVLRSTSVVRFLTQEEGVDPRRLTATGKGEFTPIDTADTSEARSANRRIEIVLSPKLDELYELIK